MHLEPFGNPARPNRSRSVQATFGILTDAITSKPYGEPLNLSEYQETIASLLNHALGKVKLDKPKAKEPPGETGVKKI